MQPLKETNVYIPTHENLKDGWVNLKDSKKIFVSEQTGYFLNKQEMLVFKREFALEILNKIKEQGDVMAWHNIKKELQAEFENKLLNNETT